MTEKPVQYDVHADPGFMGHHGDLAKRLQEITGLVALRVFSDPLMANATTRVDVIPPKLPERTYARIVGIRLFHEPREVVIEGAELGYDGGPVLPSPVDAAAYALENPMPPLLRPMDARYRGEALRFCAIDWGFISRERPLVLKASPWGNPAQPPRLYGYVVIDPTCMDYSPKAPWARPTSPDRMAR